MVAATRRFVDAPLVHTLEFTIVLEFNLLALEGRPFVQLQQVTWTWPPLLLKWTLLITPVIFGVAPGQGRQDHSHQSQDPAPEGRV